MRRIFPGGRDKLRQIREKAAREMKKMKKRLAAICLTLAVTFGGLAPALAVEETAVALTLNGYALEVEALACDGTTLVPAEAFLYALSGPDVRSYLDGMPLSSRILYRWDDAGQTLSVRWYDKAVTLIPGQDGAQLRDGVLWVPLRPLAEALGLTVGWTGRVALSYPKRRVEVDNLKDLFLAVAPDTEIVLKQGEYSFADLDPKELEGADSPYFRVDYDLFDPDMGEWGLGTVYRVIIQDVRDLTILAGGCRVATPWAYADVWAFEHCTRMTLEGGTAVHDVAPGYCMGNCVSLNACKDVVLDSVALDGSGVYGLYGEGSRNMLLKNAQITHCTYGAVALSNCGNVTVDACHIYENDVEFSLFSCYGCSGIQVSRCLIEDNSAGALGTYTDSRGVVFDDCTFGKNSFRRVSDFGGRGSGGAVFMDCFMTADGFQAFLEERALSGLVPPGRVMTQENRDGVIQSFLSIPEPERTYVALLLAQIAAGEATAADGYCDPKSGVYLTACQICLSDLDLDGVPEFILKTGGSEAEFRYTVYTIVDGALVECGGFGGGHTDLYTGDQGGLVGYAAHMGSYTVTALSLEGAELVARALATGQVDQDWGGEYPSLSELDCGAYNLRLAFTKIPTLFFAPVG